MQRLSKTIIQVGLVSLWRFNLIRGEGLQEYLSGLICWKQSYFCLKGVAQLSHWRSLGALLKRTWVSSCQIAGYKRKRMPFNKSPLSRLKRNLSLQSCFLEVRYSDAFGCKSPDDNALSVNGGLSCVGIRHSVDTYLDIDDQCTSPASSCGKTSTALRRIFPLESRSSYKSAFDIQNSKSELF